MTQINILLATHNGSQYIEEQLSSLEAQTISDWHLIIFDDASNDDTPKKIRNFTKKHAQKVTLHINRTRMGSKENFSGLLSNSQSPYFMFCDQDDIWLPNKIELSLHKIKELEVTYGKTVPLLVHTDLKVVDSLLREISPSFWQYQNLSPQTGSILPRLMMQNQITGCTIIGNKALQNAALPIPTEAIMHDWWLGLVAAAFGHIGIIEQPTILYRQHSSNALGAQSFKWYTAAKKLIHLKKIHKQLQYASKQSRAFYDSFSKKLTAEKLEIVTAHATLYNRNFLQRRTDMLKYKFLKTGLLRNLGMFIAG